MLKCWEGGLTGGLGDLLAMFANLTKEMTRRIEKGGREWLQPVRRFVYFLRSPVSHFLIQRRMW